MRKKIAVFLGEIGREFQRDFVKNIKEVANTKGYDVFVFNNFGSYASTILFDSGERDVINIPVFSEFAGVLSLSDTFDIDAMESMLIRTIKAQSDCPIVSVRNGSIKTNRVVFDDYRTAYEMTTHFIKQHGFINICYMSGPYSVEDSIKRLNGFKDAMSDNGLDVPEDAVFEGDFWKFRCKAATEFFLQSYDGKVQAIICANDYMALGICDELKNRGVRIPEDIAISGFDEVLEGCSYKPTLTSVRMPVEQMAIKAMEIIESANSGRDIPGDISIPGNLVFKGSCGCDACKNNIDISAFYNQISNDYINIRTSTLFTTDIQNRITEDEKLQFISDYTNRFGINRSYLCLCTDTYKDDNPYSEKMRLRAVFPFSDGDNSGPKDITFSRKYILPESVYDSSKPGCYIVLPIHHKNTTFGYLVSEWSECNYYHFLAPYSEGIAFAYDDMRQQEQYSDYLEIRKQNLIDPLTGVANRRGFEQSVSSLMSNKNLATDIITFVSTDLDNLKHINDTFGHHEGDIAIQSYAEVLTSVTGPDDICCRVGGDEFYLVLVSPRREDHENFAHRVEDALQRKNDELNKPYKIHASIGLSTINKDAIDKAFENIELADKRMYDNKKAYKKSLA